jgi:hypothetical protein
MVKKSDGIEEEGKKIAINIKELTDAMDHFKVTLKTSISIFSYMYFFHKYVGTHQKADSPQYWT